MGKIQLQKRYISLLSVLFVGFIFIVFGLGMVGYYSKCENLVNGEKYIAPLYNYLIKLGGKIYISK